MKRYLLYLVFTVVLATAGCTRGQWLDEVVADRQYQANAVEELKEAKATNLYVLCVNKDKDENYTIHFSNNTSTSFNIINKEEDGHKYPNMLFVTSIVDTPTKVTITIDGNGEQALTSESELTFYVIGRDGTGIPVNEIRYTTTDGTPISPQSVCFGSSDVVITSNVYKNSGGVITCGGDITLVDNAAFKGCGNLETISFPESLTTIGNSAFAECQSLKTVNLPENLTTIGDEVFLNCEALESIDLPGNITSIGFLAFAGCSSLREIVIPEGITTIVNNLFENCGNLVSVTLPEKVTTIGASAFAGCASLTNIPIPESVIAFEDNAFSGCASLASINIPDLLHTIGKSAFNGCASLTKITLPTYNLKNIGDYAFYGCSKLTSINLPVVIDNIADFLLAGCSSLTNIEIPTLITSIGEGAFNGCLALEEINIPEKVTTIGASAFAGCSKLTSVTIPSGVTSIGRSAFYNCSNLAGVYCKPTTPPAGGNSMFHSNASGRKIYVPEKNIEAYKSAEWWNNYTDDFVAYDFVKGEEAIPDNFKIFYTTTDGKVLTPNVLDGFGANVRFNTYEDGRGAIVFDGEVTHIPAEAFQSSQALATITIPEGVTTVEEGAFALCLNLSKFEGKFASADGRSLIQEGTLVAFAPFGTTKYTIPTSVTAIGGSAFAGFDNLTSITIPEGVTSIGDYAFEGCAGFTTITIPESIITIGCGALSGCSSLATVYCKPTTPPAAKVLGNYYPTPSWNAFEGSSLTLVIYVPYVSVEAYKAASGWSTYADAFVAYDFEKGEVFVTEKMKIYYTSTDGNVVTPNKTNVFGANIVSNTYANGQGVITFDGNVTKIGDQAFYKCSSLASVTIPDSVTSIGSSAFYGCSSLASITIPEGVTSIGADAFLDCSSLVSITIPNSVTSIGRQAFWNCSSLVSITIPDSVTSIGFAAFRYCRNLAEVYCKSAMPPTAVPNASSSPYWDAFDDNASDRKIYVPAENVEAYKSAQWWSEYADAFVPYDFEKGEVVVNEKMKIYYTSTDGNVVTPYATNVFGANIISNTYAEGQGVITFGGEVTKIGNQAFSGCSSLTSITIPDSVTELGSGAFSHCSHLTSFTIPDNVLRVGSDVCMDCGSLKSITIGKSVEVIEGALWGSRLAPEYSGWDPIVIYCKATTPPTWTNTYESLTYSADVDVIYIPAESVEAYKTADEWRHYSDDYIPYDFEKGEVAFSEKMKIYYTSTDGQVVTPSSRDAFGATIIFNTYENGAGVICFNGDVTKIGSNAFYNCTTLASVTIPEGVTSIDENPFRGCTNLAEFKGKFASSSGRYLEVEGVLHSFAPAGLTEYSIHNKITSIGYSAFFGCKDLVKVTIPEGVKEIERNVFRDCSSLVEVYCKATVPPTAVSDTPHSNYSNYWNAFDYNASGRKIYVPEEALDAYKSAEGWMHYSNAFVPYDFEKGEVVNLENRKIYYTSTDGNIVEPSSSAFGVNIVSNTYENGKGVIIFDGDVTKIGTNAYYNRTTLASITIPDSVTSIEGSAFLECTSLAEFRGKFASEDGCCLIVDDVFKHFAPKSELTEYTIPDSVTSIGNSAFSKCSSLTSITIPEGVTSIGYGAFSGCSSLASITIPEGVTEIGDSSFSSCSKLTSITIPNSVTSIGSYAFYVCSSLVSITIPDGVTSIGNAAFRYCSKLAEVYCKSAMPPTAVPSYDSTYWDAFDDNTSGRKIYVPEESVEAYKTAEWWSEYADAFVPYDFEKGEIVYSETQKIYYTSTDGNVVTPYHSGTSYFGANIVSNTYENGQGVITFDGNVTKIEGSAFLNCTNLTSITIPEGVTSIGYSAFSGCSSLTSITIPDSVTSIGNSAFSSCSSLAEFNGKFASEDGRCLIVNGKLNSFAPAGLTEYVIPNGVTTIEQRAFFECDELVSVTIPDGVTSIKDEAFRDCGNLASINIPEGVTEIGDYAFGITKLTSVTLPESLTSLGYIAFAYCRSLKEVYCKAITPPTAIPSTGSSPYWRAFDDNASDRKIYVPEESVEAYKTAEWWSEYADAFVPYDFEKGEVVNLENRKIYYTSTDGNIVEPSSSAFGVNIVSNTYENGQGVITFDGNVTKIGDGAFRDCSSLVSITIPDSVTSIRNYAFYNCSSLASVTIPNSVTSIRYRAFYNCSSLASITIPESATSWGSEAFYGCTGELIVNCNIPNSSSFSLSPFYGSKFTKVTIGNGVTSIGNYAFYGCSSLTSVTIPESVTSIGESAFDGCSSLTSVTIPKSVTSIGESAFDGCSSLVSITIPEGVTSIGKYAFRECSSLASTTIPEGVTSIGYGAFYGCSAIESITIPESVTSIGDNAFRSCSSLASITIPEGVASIGGSTFQSCTSLASITIPESVTSIGDYAFHYCRKLASVYCRPTMPPTAVSSNSSYWDAFDSNASDRKIYVPTESVEAYKTAEWWSEYADAIVAYDFEKGEVVNIENRKIYYTSTDGNVVTPSYKTNVFGANIISNTYADGQGVITFDGNVTKIGDQAFYDCLSLASVTIPDSVTSIGVEAFSYSSLASITIPDSVTSIGEWAFYKCESLVSITIPDSVTSIGELAFYNCSSLASITIPDSVTSIGYGAFYECWSLASVYCKPTTPPSGDWRMFNDNASGRKIYVPAESVEAYKTAEWWSEYADAFVAYDFEKGEEVNMENRKIYYTSTDGNVVTPNHSGTFYFGANIVSNTYENGQGVITFDGNVTSVGGQAFYGCKSLASIIIPEGVTSIGKGAFDGCSSLAEFKGKFASEDGKCLIVDGVLNSFAIGCGLTEYTIPEGVTSIGDFAFEFCKSLASITIPDSVTWIGDDAFFYCSSLASVTIGNGVTSIGGQAFGGCSSLASITIPDSVTSIEDCAFNGCSSLTSVTIPNSVTSMGYNPFEYCYGLKEFKGKFASEDGKCLIVDGVLNSFAIGCGLTEYIIPDGVTSIGDFAFANCKSLASVNMSDGITSIGHGAFYGCSAIESITIPESVTEIVRWAFYICRGIVSVYCKAITPPTAIPNSTSQWDAFAYNASGRKIYVPEESVGAYKTAEWWSEYADAIEPYVFE